MSHDGAYNNLTEVLVAEPQVLDLAQLERAKEAASRKRCSLFESLINEQIIAEQNLLDVLSERLGLEKIDIIQRKSEKKSTLKDTSIAFKSLFDISGVEVAFEGSLPSQVGERAGSIAVRKLTGTEYDLILRAIESDNNSQILANPHILVLDCQSAEVRMATDEPFTETSIDAENGRVIENIIFLQVGTILQVTSRIQEDNIIQMDISLDVNSLVEIKNGVSVVNHNIAILP